MAPPNVKIKHITRSPSSSGDTRFPKLDECAHFHYENVELGPIKVLVCDRLTDSGKLAAVCSSSANKENELDRLCFLVTVISNGRKWMVRRSYKNFMFLDTQLHRCVYDRKYSLLKELPNFTPEETDSEEAEEKIRNLLSEYLERFSQLAGSLINCGPVLNWFELDNRGNRLIVTDEVAINTPAVAAAYVVVPYSALATDEISFDVGDMISVIDMPPPEESSWWRGKKGFEVGFFPSECVEVIGDKVPHSFKLSSTSTKPVFRRHGKLIAFFRSFLLSRPSRRKLKQSGILKERVFGCDLGEHLLNTGREIPMVLKCCAEFIEDFGVVDGIYRLSGVSSNIQRLRLAFDEDRPINLGDPATVHDIHSVASLLKMYFRELPNPLLTYQLYDQFVKAVQSPEEVRLLRVRDVVQQLPPPHFRTLQYLLSHLARVASFGEQTGMTPKNIAIVWAPNLLRSRDVENGGVGALHVVGVQAVLTEYLIRFSDLIFDEKEPMLTGNELGEGLMVRARPKSLAISTPTKLLSLEEARARALSTHLPLTQQKYIEVGGGPDKLPPKYHTVIEYPPGLPKLKKSPSGWKSFFSRGWYSGSARDKSRQAFRTSRKASTGSLPHTSVFLQDKPISETDASCSHRKKLRTVKSAESLVHCVKESIQSTNKEDVCGASSRKSSPQVSIDSSNSLEVTSPLSKSPGLQKHTRSSSHESYFESNSMDIISDPSFEEDDHDLFYYVSEQIRMLQDSDPLPLKTDCFISNKQQAMVSSPEKSEAPQTESEKCNRKQKLDISEDFAQAKMQKLNEDKLVREDKISVPESDMPESNVGVISNSPSETHPLEEELSIDPMVLYDAIINKRTSVISSSDNENDTDNKTIVERYGNAETVLVEVHATQDSSSEEEQFIVDPLVPVFESQSVFENFDQDSSQNDSGNENSATCCSVEKSLTGFEIKDESDFELSPSAIDAMSYYCLNPQIKEMDDVECEEKTITAVAHSECKNISDDSEILPNVDIRKRSDSNLGTAKLLKNKLNLKFDIELTDSSNKSDDSAFTVNAPPSPVYPSKSFPTVDFQSLKTKIETIPLHKKKQIYNIPSPSSPVEEVRKKFEMQATSNTRKSTESPHSDPKGRSNRNFVAKQKSQDISPTANVHTEVERRRSENLFCQKSDTQILNKRYSEPAEKPTETKITTKQVCSKPENESSPIKSSSEKQNKCKVQQPSLFAQLKIRKIQLLQAEVKTTPVDPWSDPILDMQEDYHPLVTYSQIENAECDSGSNERAESKEVEHHEDVGHLEECVTEDKEPVAEHKPVVVDSMCEISRLEQNATQCITETQKESDTAVNIVDNQHTAVKPCDTDTESEAVKRERINRIKEERRAQLREKLKPESFRMEAEEKEKVQTKFRLRKDFSKSSGSVEIQDDITKSDKAVETDNADIKEAGTNCDLSSSSELLTCRSSDKKTELGKPNEGKLHRGVSKQKSSDDFILQQNKSNVGKKSARAYEDSRKWLSMPPTDIRDRVAMFERSKDTKELCRLGPNGKFPQKQSPSALTSSFVR
ncbi:uncharacterized protein LOC129227411 [Uloborus diversus]|uniref:uncharacterized protein LOC129227411 n=1 Tax=Uloborus diversus TaxID=327109 RepID=UPI00240A8EB6|nr:uncharacterized protein LOC129227411 [Uloborus diversus]